MLAVVGYAVSAIGYAFLLLLILTVRKSGLAKYLLVLATAATSVWSGVPFFFAELSIEKIIFFDNVKNLFWLLFLASCLKDNFKNIQQVLARKETWLIVSLPLFGMLIPYLGHSLESWQYLIQTTIALEFLVLLEVIYRQSGDNRWALKPLILYLAVISIFDFLTFANALMIDQVHVYYLSSRGFIYAALIPLLVLAIRRVKNWGVEIYISRDIVLHSTLLLVAGGYLLFMALVGYVVKYIGGEWDTSIQVVLIFLSLTLLLALFMSTSFRTRIKVFITKHFFANQFDYRHEWVKLTECLESPQTEINEINLTALRGFLQAIEYQSGCLLRYQHGELIKLADVDHSDLNDDEKTVLLTLSEFFKQKAWIIDLTELRTHPHNYEGLKINHALLNQARFQIIVPLYKDNEFWGMAVMLGAQHATKKLNWELRDYINAVTAQVSNFLFHQQAAKELAENAQFAAFTRMSAFVLHDLKNVLAQIDLILCNAEQHKNNPEFIEDTFETLHHTKARMEKMLSQLTEKHSNVASSESLVLLSQCIEQVVQQRCATLYPTPNVSVNNETEVVLDKEKFANVMYHLISNAQQATRDDGQIDVILDKSDNEKYMLVRIVDNGCGMSEAFIQTRLFKPFDTTKGNAGMGIGAFDAKMFLDKIGGQLSVESEEGQGSTFTLRIPI
ncbi:MAG: PEP-CTERM system histidine kinase PrsK [Paraglaciecola sp.]|uniref:XrtA/PEP-CTERM system histidine kinase PrsK n=1 Tax=Paraglaciecola sp. TaxID=1920173 RepID=UPI00273FEDC1|nr:XrtA/PEP-CTERM system histidine kinase PrsK [Paraglaciecola sp.]MDP5029340.1 PEP-CTERM system histidine kinase PrsK [Paraglaciecola sp.]MDP5133455.1 PEP-CTERM system histidine kinase PrsK [Paraglaciecola sp.]